MSPQVLRSYSTAVVCRDAGKHTLLSPRFHNLVVRVCREWTSADRSADGPGVVPPK